MPQGNLRIAPPPIPGAMPPGPPFGSDREMEPMGRMMAMEADEGKSAPELLNEASQKLALAVQRDPNLSAVVAQVMRMLDDALQASLTPPPEAMEPPPEMGGGMPPMLA